MSSQELLAEIQKLPPEERRRLLEALTPGMARTTPEVRRQSREVGGQNESESHQPISEDEVEQILLAEGIINAIPPRLPDEDEESYEPIEVPGIPLSETIVEERR